MMKFGNIAPLQCEQLYQHCDTQQLDFTTTEQLTPLDCMPGQDRAAEAIKFAISMERRGYNLYVMGPPGSGKHTLVRRFLEQEAADRSSPDDWCYVHNFQQSHLPHALQLPPGRGKELHHDLNQLIDELQIAIISAFEGNEYLSRIEAIEGNLKKQQKNALAEIHHAAEADQIKLLRTEDGFVFAPTHDGEILDPEQFNQLSPEQQKKIESTIEQLQQQLRKVLEQFPAWAKQSRAKIKELNRETLRITVHLPIKELSDHYQDLPMVLNHLMLMEEDILENINSLHRPDEISSSLIGQTEHHPLSFNRYRVNLLISHDKDEAAPVIYEDQPTYQNLVGRVEHLSHMGTLFTDFTLIKPGSLHRANGGYLILDIEKVLAQPHAWEGLKRALRSNEIRIDSLSQLLSLNDTVTLDPEAIPLDIKIVLLGDRHLYHLLNHYDSEFSELFKIVADFEDEIDRDRGNVTLFARFIATICHHEKILPLSRTAVARMVEFASRDVEDSEKLSTHMHTLCDLLSEADYCAKQREQQTIIDRCDIEQALTLQRRRVSRLSEQLQQEVIRGDIHISTDGMKVGQVNGLTVISLSDHMFGQPSRITATVRLGEGEIIDIEREVEMAGPIHSKGVMILASFIGHRYSRNRPLSFHASLVFEQSYGMVDGDSASLAELCSLLSAIAETPINQALAITGSVNQHGEVQPIGGVNEKIEGYFKICKARGLDGHHGVIIPQDNVKHLMLNQEVIDAVADEKFRIFAVNHVDQAASLLMSIEAGEMDISGQYPLATLNYLISEKLAELAVIRHTFGDMVKEMEEE